MLVEFIQDTLDQLVMLGLTRRLAFALLPHIFGMVSPFPCHRCVVNIH